MIDESRFLAFRARFPIFKNKIYLNSCSQGALSDAVDAALRSYLESWNREGSPWEFWCEVQEELRGEFASLIGASPEEIAVTSSASTAIYSVASALCYGERSKVVLGELEFPTQCHIWLAQQSRGARIAWVSSRGGGIDPEDYRAVIDATTAIVPATHVCFRNGFRIRPAEVCRAAHEVGAYFLLDDYQSCGTRLLDVHAADIDFYVTGALKYLLAASGVAFLYVKRALIENLSPTLTGWFAQRNPFTFDIRHHDPADSAMRFQAGTPPIPSVYCALAGIRLLREIGLERVQVQIARLSRKFIEGAGELGLHLKTPADSEGPLVVVAKDNAASAAETVACLAKKDIVVSSRDNGVRISFHAYNSMDDVDAVLDALTRA